jgi:hypothetical protein
MRKFVKMALASSLAAGLGISAALANETQISITADVQEFIALQIEKPSGVVVSDDDMDPVIGTTGSPVHAVLDFGDVDAFGNLPGNFDGTNGSASGTLERTLLVGGNVQPLTYNAGPLAAGDGALYYVSEGYQLHAYTNGAETDLDVTVDVAGANALDALVDFSGDTQYTSAGSPVGTGSILTAGSSLNALGTLTMGTPQLIDLGVHVTLDTTPGVKTTDIIFTGS